MGGCGPWGGSQEGGEEGGGGPLTHQPLPRCGILPLPGTHPKVGAAFPWPAASPSFALWVPRPPSMTSSAGIGGGWSSGQHYCSWSGPDKTWVLTDAKGPGPPFPATLKAAEKTLTLNQEVVTRCLEVS